MEDARVEFNSFEPSLDEGLAEPVVRLMRRDGVSDDSVRRLRRQAAARTQSSLRLSMPQPGIGREASPPARVCVLAQAPAPAWPRVFPEL